jgi:hypothetical protein
MSKELRLETISLSAGVKYPVTVPGDFIGIQSANGLLNIVTDNNTDTKLMAQGQTSILMDYERVHITSDTTQTVKIYLGFGRINNIPTKQQEYEISDKFYIFTRVNSTAGWEQQLDPIAGYWANITVNPLINAYINPPTTEGNLLESYILSGKIASFEIQALSSNTDSIFITDANTGTDPITGSYLMDGFELRPGASREFNSTQFARLFSLTTDATIGDRMLVVKSLTNTQKFNVIWQVIK